MALSTYAELKTTIANWLNRTDLTSEIAEDFIVLAEADFNSKLRIRQMHSQTTITINDITVATNTKNNVQGDVKIFFITFYILFYLEQNLLRNVPT